MPATRVPMRPAYPWGAVGRFPRSHSPVHPQPDPEARERAERLAKFLGWFSLGLGATALLAPRGVARMIGAKGDRTDCTLLRVVGVQELACGLGILATRRPAGWMWARVAGDAAHVALTSTSLASGARHPERMAATAAALVGVGALDAYTAIGLSRGPGPMRGEVRGGRVFVHQTITIGRPAVELYAFWRDFENLPRIMSHLESVQVQADGRSHWKARAPMGMTVEWDAEVAEDRTGEFIAWRSVGGDVDNAGTVRFAPAPGGRGTEVHVEMVYDPPGGLVGRWVAKLFGEAPEQQVYDDLRHFKQVMETGEVVLSDSSWDGTHMLQRPAQPPESLAHH